MSNINNDQSNLPVNRKITKQELIKPNSSINFKNDDLRKSEIQSKTANDVKVDISDRVKDFSKIKKVVDSTAEIDNQDKIDELKKSISSGDYQIDYDELAQQILDQEF